MRLTGTILAATPRAASMGSGQLELTILVDQRVERPGDLVGESVSVHDGSCARLKMSEVEERISALEAAWQRAVQERDAALANMKVAAERTGRAERLLTLKNGDDDGLRKRLQNYARATYAVMVDSSVEKTVLKYARDTGVTVEEALDVAISNMPETWRPARINRPQREMVVGNIGGDPNMPVRQPSYTRQVFGDKKQKTKKAEPAKPQATARFRGLDLDDDGDGDHDG